MHSTVVHSNLHNVQHIAVQPDLLKYAVSFPNPEKDKSIDAAELYLLSGMFDIIAFLLAASIGDAVLGLKKESVSACLLWAFVTILPTIVVSVYIRMTNAQRKHRAFIARILKWEQDRFDFNQTKEVAVRYHAACIVTIAEFTKDRQRLMNKSVALRREWEKYSPMSVLESANDIELILAEDPATITKYTGVQI